MNLSRIKIAHLLKCFFFITFLILLFIFLSNRNLISGADKTISNSTPSLAEEIEFSGTLEEASSSYYLIADNAGPFYDFSEQSEHYEEKAISINSDTSLDLSSLNTDKKAGYWAYNLEDIDKVIYQVTYYDAIAASPLFSIKGHDIDASSSTGTFSCDFNSSGSGTYVTGYCVLEPEKGMTSEHITVDYLANTIYISDISKLPAWEIQTDDTGNFEEEIIAPRRSGLDSNGIFTNTINYYYLNPNTKAYNSFGNITLSVDLTTHRMYQDMLRFKYDTIASQDTRTNMGGMFSSLTFYSTPYFVYANWDNGYLGGIYNRLNLTTKENLFSSKLPTAYGENGEFQDLTLSEGSWVGSLGNTSDNTIAAYHYLFSKYEQGDTSVKPLMDKIITYTRNSYNEETGLVSTTIVRDPTRIWIDRMGIGALEYMYKYGSEFSTTDKDYAKRTLEYMIDEMQENDGHFIHDKNWETDAEDSFDVNNIYATEEKWWNLNQAWALVGLNGMLDLFETYDETDTELINKAKESRVKLVDSILAAEASQFVAPQRSAILVYGLSKVENNSDFVNKKSEITALKNQLLYHALRNYSTDLEPMTTFGNLYNPAHTSGDLHDGDTGSFPEFFLLKYFEESLADQYFVPNNGISSFNYSFNTEDNYLYTAQTFSNDFDPDEEPQLTDTSSQVITLSNSNTSISGSLAANTLLIFNRTNLKINSISGSIKNFATNVSDVIYQFTLDGNSLSGELTGLNPNKTYQVLSNNAIINNLEPDVNGIATFSLSNGGTFQIKASDSTSNLIMPSTNGNSLTQSILIASGLILISLGLGIGYLKKREII